MQGWKMTDKVAGVENAGLENDGQICRGGKFFCNFCNFRLSASRSFHGPTPASLKLTDKNHRGWKMTDTLLKDS